MGVLLGSGLVPAVAEADPLLVGVYADALRTQSCVGGNADGTFRQHVWAWTPPDQGLVYVTLRFDFPQNLDRRARPVFHEAVSEVILTDYSDGTEEWNMIFDGTCPPGWVEVFTQECVLLDDAPSLIGIEARHSMIRDCTFVLNDVVVVSELGLNHPGCDTVMADRSSWSAVKKVYRP